MCGILKFFEWIYVWVVCVSMQCVHVCTGKVYAKREKSIDNKYLFNR